jgi:hypothetical protein
MLFAIRFCFEKKMRSQGNQLGPMTNNSFTDRFASWAVHLYRITPAQKR